MLFGRLIQNTTRRYHFGQHNKLSKIKYFQKLTRVPSQIVIKVESKIPSFENPNANKTKGWMNACMILTFQNQI